MDHPLRLMTWNVRSLRDDRAAIVDVLKQAAPDVLFVQEAPRFLRARSKLAALARESGLVVVCGGRSAAGVAVLSSLRMSVDGVKEMKLPKTKGLHQRGMAIADLALLERQFTVGSVHLGLQAEERRLHTAQICEVFSTASQSVVAGDFNESDDAPSWRTFADRWVDAGALADLPTFSAARPTRRIDTIFVPRSWSTRAISPHETVGDATLVRATDHRPVIVDVMG